MRCARTRTTVVADEAHQALALAPGLADDMPRPLAAHAPDAITIGSASKSFWGGLRLGWVRAPLADMDRLLQARIGLDLGAPVFEQLVLADLLDRADEVLPLHRERLVTGRDALVDGRPRAPPVVALPRARRRARTLVRAARGARHRDDGRGRASGRRRRPRSGVRGGGRPRPLRADPLDRLPRRPHRGRTTPRRRVGARDHHLGAGRSPAGSASRCRPGDGRLGATAVQTGRHQLTRTLTVPLPWKSRRPAWSCRSWARPRCTSRAGSGPGASAVAVLVAGVPPGQACRRRPARPASTRWCPCGSARRHRWPRYPPAARCVGRCWPKVES